MKNPILIALPLLLLPLTATAGIYRCEIDGEMVFSQLPCSENAEEIELQVYTPEAAETGEPPDGNQETAPSGPEGESYVERKRLERQISGLEKDAEKLARQRDKELDALKKRLKQASSQLQAAELQLKAVDVQNSYNSRISDITKQLRELRKQQK